MTNGAPPQPSRIETARRLAALTGLLGAMALAAGWHSRPHQFYRSYLLAFLFWAMLSLGCLSLVLLHRLTGGAWGEAIRSVLDAGAKTLPLVAVLFVPLAFAVREVYPWAGPAATHDPLMAHKAAYLNVPFFLGRAALFFVIWIALALVHARWSARLEAGEDPVLAHRLRNLAGGGLVALVLTTTLASVDWAMSLDPHWFSTIYGIIFLVGSALTALSFAVAVLSWLARETPEVLRASTSHDLGKLVFAFVMLWAYVSFSQFLVIWSANLPEEIPWYLRRLAGGWQWLALLVVFVHFLLPFLLLLSHDLKRDARRLGLVALGLLGARLCDLFWLVAPDTARHGPGGLAVHWLDLAAPVALGGLWLALFFWHLARRPPLPAPAAARVDAPGTTTLEAA